MESTYWGLRKVEGEQQQASYDMGSIEIEGAWESWEEL